MSNRPHSIATAQVVHDDEVIDIVGQLSGVQVKTDKNGKTFYNIKLTGDGQTIFGNVWLKWTPEPLIGKTVIARQAKMGTYNDRRSFSAMRGAVVEEFSEDMDAPPQQVPQNRPTPSGYIHPTNGAQNAPKATGTAKLGEYAALYAECLKQASATLVMVRIPDTDREMLRNIASCFFIQAIKDGVRVEGGESGNVPF